jgi:hypothetical protein
VGKWVTRLCSTALESISTLPYNQGRRLLQLSWIVLTIPKKLSPWCDIKLETSEAMANMLETAPDQLAWWKDTRNRLAELWWRFLYLLFHCDPGLDGLHAERDGIIQRFRNYILLMTHDPICKHGTRALVLIERKPKIVKLFMVMDVYSPVIQMQFKGLYSLHPIMYG